MDPEDQQRLRPVNAPISGFANEVVNPIGQITFALTLTDGERSRTEEISFLVLPVTSRHNVIRGRDALAVFNAIPSTTHGMLGLPTPKGVCMIKAEESCNIVEERPAKALKPADPEPEQWALNPSFPEQKITLGSTIS